MEAIQLSLLKRFNWRVKLSILAFINKDTRFREPRKWSNRELGKIVEYLAPTGSAVNVSAWQDRDKEGSTYKEKYFYKASDYWITNWKSDAFGFQGGLDKEMFLDLEEDLSTELYSRFDIVFNHTTLEHVFDVQKAFKNLCLLSKDKVIVVVPFLQEQHTEYGDYWRFTPWCVKRLFEKNGYLPLYISVNDGPVDSIYVFAVGARSSKDQELLSSVQGNIVNSVEQILVGQQFCDRKGFLVKQIERIITRLKLVTSAVKSY